MWSRKEIGSDSLSTRMINDVDLSCGFYEIILDTKCVLYQAPCCPDSKLIVIIVILFILFQIMS